MAEEDWIVVGDTTPSVPKPPQASSMFGQRSFAQWRCWEQRQQTGGITFIPIPQLNAIRPWLESDAAASVDADEQRSYFRMHNLSPIIVQREPLRFDWVDDPAGPPTAEQFWLNFLKGLNAHWRSSGRPGFFCARTDLLNNPRMCDIVMLDAATTYWQHSLISDTIGKTGLIDMTYIKTDRNCQGKFLKFRTPQILIEFRISTDDRANTFCSEIYSDRQYTNGTDYMLHNRAAWALLNRTDICMKNEAPIVWTTPGVVMVLPAVANPNWVHPGKTHHDLKGLKNSD